MNTTASKITPQLKLSVDELNDLIIDSIQDIKGINVLKLDLKKLHDSPVDYFIICEGESHVQVRAIAENIQRRLKQEAKTFASNTEGMKNAYWVCLDYFHTVVHIFYHEARKFYELEELWSDASFTTYDNL
ncbi:MAG: ribosome silencing factor [Saprospiraceae bacterium]|nr:ribosome silencing factor [Saprospiraceae bacterium]